MVAVLIHIKNIYTENSCLLEVGVKILDRKRNARIKQDV